MSAPNSTPDTLSTTFDCIFRSKSLSLLDPMFQSLFRSFKQASMKEIRASIDRMLEHLFGRLRKHERRASSTASYNLSSVA